MCQRAADNHQFRVKDIDEARQSIAQLVTDLFYRFDTQDIFLGGSLDQFADGKVFILQQ